MLLQMIVKDVSWLMSFFSSSYAEMESAEKNKISHRARALKKLQTWFEGQQETA